MRELDLYIPMCKWLQRYLADKYKKGNIIVADTHNKRLDRALAEYDVICDVAIGINIQIDVLGIVKNSKRIKLFFVEAKKTDLTLKDLGQLWAYCKLIDPEEAFLLTSANLGSLDKLINVYKREDMLNFGDSKNIKMMRIAVWNINTGIPDMATIVPKL